VARCIREGRRAHDARSTGDESVRALATGSPEASVLEFMRAVTGPTLDLNLLWVNMILPTLHEEMVHEALHTVRAAYASVGLHVGTTREVTLPIDAAPFSHIAVSIQCASRSPVTPLPATAASRRHRPSPPCGNSREMVQSCRNFAR
jgi:hypothetical protein